MKQAIVFFDIDGVIFDAKKFAESFYQSLQDRLSLPSSDIQNLRFIYQQVRNEKGFFDPEIFLTKISSQYSIAKEDLNKFWWDEETFQKCMLADEKLLKQIQEKTKIGIFSKGEINFQKKKIEKFSNLINPEDVYIFENKIVKINEVLAKYKDCKIYTVDDNLKVLENFKQADNSVFTILVKKDKAEIISNQIDAVIADLSEIIPLLAQ